jgi:hypothetical protein
VILWKTLLCQWSRGATLYTWNHHQQHTLMVCFFLALSNHHQLLLLLHQYCILSLWVA